MFLSSWQFPRKSEKDSVKALRIKEGGACQRVGVSRDPAPGSGAAAWLATGARRRLPAGTQDAGEQNDWHRRPDRGSRWFRLIPE